MREETGERGEEIIMIQLTHDVIDYTALTESVRSDQAQVQICAPKAGWQSPASSWVGSAAGGLLEQPAAAIAAHATASG